MTHSVAITPVLLCGGSGTRLWPLSRKSYPKQFVPLMGEETMFQASAKLMSDHKYGQPVILTNSDFRFIVTEQLAEIGIDPSAVLIEPEGRNTAPAILAAALWLHKENPDALMLVTPSDHIIPDSDAFQKAVDLAVNAALKGNMVTFGIKPTYPETGYGYLQLKESVGEDCNQAMDLTCFVEKPDEDKAKQMLASGHYLWNAGIFLFSVKTIIEAFKTHCPDLIKAVQPAIDHSKHDLGFLRLEAEAFGKADSISIDYAVMEKADNLSVVPFSAGWSDLGGWDAVWRESEKDENDVSLSGPSTSIDCKNSLLRSEHANLEVVGIGLDNIMAIAMP
ncbi:MAG: mannose-1-phosphate guanylyltransferase/mannose-6-phosphate isomerase, partial [Cohaesibacter sp.]|nr:mannose-1-phosphate guanylyltransferase/mannose-6-phosphate isomerase [Cohaesibacter sp.]